MLKQYDILRMCEVEIRGCSDLQVIHKISIEMLLLQLKHLLLAGNVSVMLKDDPDSEKQFLDLYDHVRHFCGTDCMAGEVEMLIMRLQKMKTGLEDHYSG